MDTWRDRLKAALQKSGKSMRAASLEAGKAHGYLNSLLNEGKDPTISNLEDVCRVLGVSVAEILYGYPVEDLAEFLDLLKNATPRKKRLAREILDSDDKEP